MRKTLGYLLLGMLLSLAGCSRSADPLDWKIEAGDPAEMQKWLGKNLPAMPVALSRELNICINNISLTLPPARSGEPSEKANRLCRRLDGKTVRQVLIEGNDLSHQMMLARTKNLSDELIRLMNSGDSSSLTEAQRDALLERAASTRLDLQEVKQQLARSQDRLTELRASATK